MNKTELAQYLVNLHSLMQAQAATGGEQSKMLSDEYIKAWGQLKEAVKEEEDETRPREQQHVRTEDGTEVSRNFPRGSFSAGERDRS